MIDNNRPFVVPFRTPVGTPSYRSAPDACVISGLHGFGLVCEADSIPRGCVSSIDVG